jgi:cytochrome P450
LEDVELGGHVIPKGDRVFFLTQVINRDPDVFVDAATFDIDREPNSHMAFGFGPHVCLGMHLARLEMIVALEALARRCPDLDLAVEPAELRGVTSPTLLGWESLPVRVGSEARS